MSVTIRDIAEKVGKSITTVSRALHDYDDVSPETKALVRQAARELGYTAHKQAASLKKRRSDAIGLILPTFGPRFSDPFFSEFIAGVGNKASEYDFDLLVSTRSPGERELEAYRQDLQSRRVDGFILLRVRTQDARVEYLTQARAHFVAFGRTQSDHQFPYVDEDSAEGMRQVAKHLASLGHQQIGLIAPPADLNYTQLRVSGFKEGLHTQDLDLEEALIREGDLTQRSGFELANELLDLPQPPSAIAAGNDLMALGAMSAAQERGLKVGRDISVTGFDDLPMAEHSHPPLTTVRQPIYRIGNMVCEMLIRLIIGESLEYPQRVLIPELIVRHSTGPASWSAS